MKNDCWFLHLLNFKVLWEHLAMLFWWTIVEHISYKFLPYLFHFFIFLLCWVCCWAWFQYSRELSHFLVCSAITIFLIMHLCHDVWVCEEKKWLWEKKIRKAKKYFRFSFWCKKKDWKNGSDSPNFFQSFIIRLKFLENRK